MKSNLEAYQIRQFQWHALLISLLFLTLAFTTFEVSAKTEVSGKPSQQLSYAKPTAKLLDQKLSGKPIDCTDDQRCKEILELCEDREFCLMLFRICQNQPELCEELVEEARCELEDDCEALPECNNEEEKCEELPECNNEEEECEELPECNNEEEECEEPPECNSEEEECENIPEGVTTGYQNPNPLPDTTEMIVEQQAANKASRFLAQATLGADYATISQVASFGEEIWLESQFQQPAGYLLPYIQHLFQKQAELDEQYPDSDLIGGPLSFHMHAWWTQVMTSPDLVRQRVAMALSEIFVVSSNVEIIGESPYVVSQYYDTLIKHSFGNFRDLLKDISLNPAMAIYLSHLNNEKANPERGTYPDENYAREVMQLFSIGLFELNPDGTRKKDQNGNDIPTYGQEQIREFAKVFTGLSMDHAEGFGYVPCCNEDFQSHATEMKPLKMFDNYHSSGEKRLLNGLVLPAGQSGMQDVDAAIDNLFNHPNVGPFIGKQLIQRLVKSNPSPAYVARVSAAFNGAGKTPRGDMKNVLRAILLDPEARSMTNAKSQGRLREPFLRLVRLARAFNASTENRTFAAEGYEVVPKIKQYVFFAPSVFNFFQPNYTPNGELKDAGLVAPEFQITNASTIIEVKNLVDLWVDSGRLEERIGALAPEVVSFEKEIALAADPDALLNRLDTLLTYGTLSDNTRAVIKGVIEQEPDLSMRVKKAVYLLAVSPDYAVAI